MKKLCLQKYNVLAMALAQIMVPVMSQLEPVFVIPDFKEICVKVTNSFQKLTKEV